MPIRKSSGAQGWSGDREVVHGAVLWALRSALPPRAPPGQWPLWGGSPPSECPAWALRPCVSTFEETKKTFRLLTGVEHIVGRKNCSF